MATTEANAAAKAAVKAAATKVAEAITLLAELGPEAPSTVREALASLGCCYSKLGWADPDVSYGIKPDRMELD